MTWTTRRVFLWVRPLTVAAACLLSLLFFTPRAQAAVERLTFGGQLAVDLTVIHDPADPGAQPTWAWDSGSNTLTLDGYNGPGIEFYSGTGNDTVTVVFAGSNAMQSPEGHGLSANCNLTLRAASMSAQDRLTCRGGGAYGAGILAQSGVQGKLDIESGVVMGYGAFLDGEQDAGGVGIQAQQVSIREGARAVARGGDGGAVGGMGLYTTGLLELDGRGARLDALGGHAKGLGGDGVVCAGASMLSPNTALYTTGGNGAQPGNGLRHTAGYPFDLANGYLTAAPGNATTGAKTAFGTVTSGNFRVSGGTHLITGGIQCPQYGLVITGGSLRTAAADIVDVDGRMVLPIDSLGNKVYLTRPAVSGGAWAQIDTIYFRRDPPGGYNTTGIVANSVGRLFLWLPSNTAISGVASGFSEHRIEPALVTSEDHGARGTIHAATSEDGQLLAVSADEDGPLTVMSEEGTTTGQLSQPVTASTATQPPMGTEAPKATATPRAARATATPKPKTTGAQDIAAANGAGQEAQANLTGQQLAAGGNPINPANLPGQQLAAGNTQAPGKTSKDEKVPPTGDEGRTALWLALLGVALAAMWLLERKKRAVK